MAERPAGPARDLSADQAADLAAAALGRACHAAVSLTGVEELSDDDRRNLILRARAAMPDGVQPVIVKATRDAGYAPASAEAFASHGFVREWAARRLLAESRDHSRLALLAGDAIGGVMVFADLGADSGSLVDPLLEGDAPEAEQALTGYARALAHLHAATGASAGRHGELLRAEFPAATPPRCMGLSWLTTPPEIGGVTLPEQEIEAVRRRIADPGPWLALVHGDLCPDNILFADDRASPIDFEHSAPGHALLDAAFWQMGFPTCWCAGVLPTTVVERIEATYRRELAPAIPQAADDRAYARELSIATLTRLVFHLRWLLPGAFAEDARWGIAFNRSRILWHLRAAIDACDRAQAFAASRQVAWQWLAHLQDLWPESRALGVYPAFAGPD